MSKKTDKVGKVGKVGKVTKEEMEDNNKLGGQKEISQDIEKMSKPAKTDKKCLPSFFIKPEARQKICVDILSLKEDGKIVSVTKSGLGINFVKDFPSMVHTELIFEFSIPNYEDMTTYRQRSSVFRKEVGMSMIDKLQLRNHLLVWHLKSWNLTDSEGKVVELKTDKEGALNDESLSILYSVSPTLMDVVLTLFEKEVLMT